MTTPATNNPWTPLSSSELHGVPQMLLERWQTGFITRPGFVENRGGRESVLRPGSINPANIYPHSIRCLQCNMPEDYPLTLPGVFALEVKSVLAKLIKMNEPAASHAFICFREQFSRGVQRSIPVDLFIPGRNAAPPILLDTFCAVQGFAPKRAQTANASKLANIIYPGASLTAVVIDVGDHFAARVSSYTPTSEILYLAKKARIERKPLQRLIVSGSEFADACRKRLKIDIEPTFRALEAANRIY